MKPLLTVAIPTYNGGENLKRAVLSCKHIKLPEEEFEILVIDNCSTDNSIEKIENLTLEMKNIRIIKNKVNVGRVGNWNRCLEEAKGKYLLFLFSNDEIYSENPIHIVLEEYKNSDYPTIMLNTLLISENNSIVGKFYNYEQREYNLEDFIRTYFLKNFAAFGILQSHIFNFEYIKLHGLRFNPNISRTTDRMFIFDCINKNTKKFVFNDSVITLWKNSPSRYHYSVHNRIIDNIRIIDFLSKFNEIWLQELIANSYILSSIGYDEIDVVKLHLKKFKVLRILSTLKKIFKNDRSKTIQEETLPLFISYLESIIKINSDYSLKDDLYLKLSLSKEVLYRIIEGGYQSIGKRIKKQEGPSNV